MRLLEDRRLRDMYDLLHDVPDSSGMAGGIFEAIAHRMLSGKDTPQPTAMISDGNFPPTFSTTDAQPPPASPHDSTRAVMTVDLLHDLSDVTPDSNRYYIPVSATNPLFDSFTIALDAGQHTAVVSIYQITISLKHRGSGDGYLLIHKIMAHSRKLLDCQKNYKPNIKVKYFLVCPEDGSEYQWKMPSGWNKNNAHYDQIWEVFCICVPSHYLTVHRVY